MKHDHVIPLEEAYNFKDKIGEKAYRLSILIKEGFTVPRGFVIPYDVHQYYLNNKDFPPGFKASLKKSLENEIGKELIIVRSAADVEDSGKFAGLFKSVIGIKKNDLEGVLDAIVTVYESASAEHIIKLTKQPPRMSVIIQELVYSKASGIAFTSYPSSGYITIEATFGLGYLLASGRITPDIYLLECLEHKCEVLYKKRGKKEKIAVIDKGRITEVENPINDFSLSDNVLKSIAGKFKKIEKIFLKSQDIEFSLENETLYILQTRDSMPGTGLVYSGPPSLITGIVFKPPGVPPKEKYILVIDEARPDYVTYLKNAIAVVADRGGALCHLAILCRYIGIPYIVLPGIYERVKNGEKITIKPNIPSLTEYIKKNKYIKIVQYIPPQPEIARKDRYFLENLPNLIGMNYKLKVLLKDNALYILTESLYRFVSDIISEPNLLNAVLEKMSPRQKALIAALIVEPLFRYLSEKYGIHIVTEILRDIPPLYLRLKGEEPYLKRFGIKEFKLDRSLIDYISKIVSKEIYQKELIKIDKKDQVIVNIIKKLMKYYEEKDVA